MLKQYQLQLEELESGISAYREELGSISEQAKARSNQYTVRSSETMGIVRLTRIDDQGVPRLYMFNKMEFISRKDNANLQLACLSKMIWVWATGIPWNPAAAASAEHSLARTEVELDCRQFLYLRYAPCDWKSCTG